MENEKFIVIGIIAASILTFFLIIVFILFFVIYHRKIILQENLHQLSVKKKEVELLQSVIETQESERQKIAMNLHDSVNPHLTALKLTITKHEFELKRIGVEMKDTNLEKKLIDEIIEQIHIVTRDLSPQILYRYGLGKALGSFVTSIAEVETSFMEKNPENIKLSDQIALNVYRISLELLQNILKHENSTKINVVLCYTETAIVLEISHNGTGISNENFEHLAKQSTGIGLNSLTSRTVFLNAILDYQNDPESKITLTVPLNGEKAELE
jgi:signal transduction histidine kinase